MSPIGSARQATLLLLLLLFVACGCGDKSAAPPPPSAAPPALAAVPEPEHVGATLAFADGGATWDRLRGALGGDGALLPSRFGTFVVSAVGLPIACAEMVSDHEPVVGAMLEPSLLRPFDAAVAIHLRSADGVLGAATHGSPAMFTSERKPDSKGDVLTRIGSGPNVALGIFGNHLVVGTSVDAITTLGPWLARTASATLAKAIPSEKDGALEIREGALSLALPVLRMKASLPEGPAGSVLNPFLKALFARIDGATHLSISLSATDKATTLVGTAERPAAPVDGARVAPVAALLGLPKTIDLGLLDAHDAPSAPAPASPFGAIAEFLEPTERADAEKAGRALAAARSSRALVGFESGAVGPAVYARADWVDAEKGRAALAELIEIANRDATRDALGAHGVRLQGKRTVIENVGAVARFRIGPAPADPKKPAPATPDARDVDVLFRDGDQSLDVASGAEAASALRALLGPDHLDADAAVGALAALLPKEASAALFLDVARLVHGARTDRSRALLVEVDAPTAVTVTAVLDRDALRVLLRLLVE